MSKRRLDPLAALIAEKEAKKRKSEQSGAGVPPAAQWRKKGAIGADEDRVRREERLEAERDRRAASDMHLRAWDRSYTGSTRDEREVVKESDRSSLLKAAEAEAAP